MVYTYTEAFFIVAVVILIFSLVADAYSIYLMKIHKKKWYVILPILIWSIHITIFYSVIIYVYTIQSNLETFFGITDLGNMWSAVQRIHGMITVIYLTYILHLEMTK